MLQKRHNMMKMGTLGAIGGLLMISMVSGKVRKRVTRTGRNAYFRISDMVQDIMDMKK